MFACVNGTVVEEAAAGVALWDHGLTVGDGVFETIAVRHGAAMAVTRHLARLARSAAGLVARTRGFYTGVPQSVCSAHMRR